jgi:hypothetical protein
MSLFTSLFQKKEQPIHSNSDFWTWFQEHEKRFHRVMVNGKNIERQFFDKIGPKLNELRDGYFYLTGMSDDNTVELIITADGLVKNFVFVEELINDAPLIPGWKFTAHKPELNIQDVSINVEQFTFGESTLYFVPNENRSCPDEINLSIVYTEYDEHYKTEITNGVYIFLDNYLGELNFATSVDELTIVAAAPPGKDVIPIGKLKDYLRWREKEFIEKYEGKRFEVEKDMHAVFEAELKNGKPLVAVMNTDLLEWNAKASHPWMLVVELKYNGSDNNGLPGEQMLNQFERLELDLLMKMEDSQGILYVGRQTGDGSREIFFACNNFRDSVKAAEDVLIKYSHEVECSYDIFKDKYWKTFKKFSKHQVH